MTTANNQQDLKNAQSSFNATVPVDAPILPPQTFVNESVRGWQYAEVDAGGLLKAAPIFVTAAGVQTDNFDLFDQIWTSISAPYLTRLNGYIDMHSSTGQSGSFLRNASFPALVNHPFGSTFNFSSTKLASADFSSLAILAGTLDFHYSAIGAIDFPALVTLSGLLDFHSDADGDPMDAAPTFPVLTTLSGTLDIRKNEAIAIDDLFIALAATVTTGGGTIDARLNGAPTSASAAARTYLTGLGITILTG